MSADKKMLTENGVRPPERSWGSTRLCLSRQQGLKSVLLYRDTGQLLVFMKINLDLVC